MYRRDGSLWFAWCAVWCVKTTPVAEGHNLSDNVATFVSSALSEGLAAVSRRRVSCESTDNFDVKVQAAIDKIIKTAHRHGKYVGFSTGDPATAVAVAKKGCDWLNIGGDVGSMIAFINAMYKDIRSKL